MANGGGTPIPVWGIEVGSGALRAVRAVRRDDGGFDLLTVLEQIDDDPGPESLVTFIRRHGLKKHPLIVAMSSPTINLRTPQLAMESVGMDDEDTRSELMEFIHQEPEDVEFRHEDLGQYRYLVSAENRMKVEAYIAALSGAGLPAYALTTSLETMLRMIRDHGLFTGDGVIVRVEPRWTDVILLDGDEVEYQGLPIGSNDLGTEESRRSLGADLKRLVEFRRHRKRRTEGESEEDSPSRFLLLGLPPEVRARVTPHLPGEAVTLSASDTPIAGRGRIDPIRLHEILTVAPGAVGAAIAGTADPRRLQLAFRALPADISAPRGPVGLWIAAAALLVVAVGLAFFGMDAERKDLAVALSRLRQPRIIHPAPEDVERLASLSRAARRRLALPIATGKILDLLPGPGAAPYTTDALELIGRDDGGFDAHLALRFPELAPDIEASRIASWLLAVEARAPGRHKVEPTENGVVVHIRFPVEGEPR